MKSSNWKLGTLAAMAVAASAVVSQAQAAFITLVPTPSSPTTLANEPVSVDIVVNGLPSASGGFSLSLDYSGLTFVSYALGAGWGASPLDLSLGDLGGTVDFLALEDSGVLEPAAFIAQGSGGDFTLATVSFTGPATPGAFTLGLRDVAVSNFNGDTNDPAFNLLICSGAGCKPTSNVPEPTTGLLVAAALGALGFSRRQKQAA
jgi:hypothetical protein